MILKRFQIHLFATLYCCVHVLYGSSGSPMDKDGELAVQMEVVSQLHYHQIKGNYAYLSAYDEYLHFADILRKSLCGIDGKYTFVISRFPGKFDPKFPTFTVYLNEWRSYHEGEVRGVFGVKFQKKDKSVELGPYVGKSNLTIAPMRSLRDESYHQAMRKACEKFVKDLKPVLENWEPFGNGGSVD